jgi:predicted dinucleotide-binding enzyme
MTSQRDATECCVLRGQRKGEEGSRPLITDTGFEPIDAGPLRIARYTEPFTPLVGQLAYEGERGPAMAYRFEWFDERG